MITRADLEGLARDALDANAMAAQRSRRSHQNARQRAEQRGYEAAWRAEADRTTRRWLRALADWEGDHHLQHQHHRGGA